MREMSFSQHWAKLEVPGGGLFTTFRFTDWFIGEHALVVLHARTKVRQALFVAEIVAKEPRWMYILHPLDGTPRVSEEEAQADGFEDAVAMWKWLYDHYPLERLYKEPMNKLTLRRIP